MRIQEKKMPSLICYGKKDDLVEKETALAPLDFIEAEVAAISQGAFGHSHVVVESNLRRKRCSTTC